MKNLTIFIFLAAIVSAPFTVFSQDNTADTGSCTDECIGDPGAPCFNGPSMGLHCAIPSSVADITVSFSNPLSIPEAYVGLDLEITGFVPGQIYGLNLSNPAPGLDGETVVIQIWEDVGSGFEYHTTFLAPDGQVVFDFTPSANSQSTWISVRRWEVIQSGDPGYVSCRFGGFNCFSGEENPPCNNTCASHSETLNVGINNFSLEISEGSLLPVELSEFNATAKETHVDLFWSTSTELNNDFFELQRSVDLVNFRTLALIGGAGNSQEVHSYDWTDLNPSPGVNYYRLKQVDFDGQFSYSKIVSVSMNGVKIAPEIFPNPATNEVNLLTGGDGDVLVTILNPQGQQIATWNGNQPFSVANLAAGVYTFRIMVDNINYTQRVAVGNIIRP